MKPILFPSTATTFTSNGLGVLSDAVSCVVTEERNGEYECVLQYPVGGIHYSDIHDRAIIMAIPSPHRSAQPFRIYMTEAPLNGIVTIHARHISYDLSGIPVEPFLTFDCDDVLTALEFYSAVNNPFTVWTDIPDNGVKYEQTTIKSFRACLGGEEGSVLDLFGGEYEFDKFAVKLHKKRGTNNGVRIAYGRNITDFNMERNLSDIVTGVYPFWGSYDYEIAGGLFTLPEKIINIYDPTNPDYLLESGGKFLVDSNGDFLVSSGTFNFTRVIPLDLTDKFEEEPTYAELREAARKYIADNSLGVPKVSMKVSFVDLASTTDYQSMAMLEAVDLCDIVTVEFPMYGISVQSEIVSIETDVLNDRYNEVTIGDIQGTIASTISSLETNSVSKAYVGSISNQIGQDVDNLEYAVEIQLSAIDYDAGTATLEAQPYKNGEAQTASSFNYTWTKVSPDGTRSVLGNTTSQITVTDINATYEVVLN